MTENASARPNRRRRNRRPSSPDRVEAHGAAHADTTARPERRSSRADTSTSIHASASRPEVVEGPPQDAVHDHRSFVDLGLAPALAQILDQQGISTPFPIQSATLPDALSGRDLLGRGRTGSGKTLAFSLPMVQRLIASTSRRQPKKPRALVLVPTRELANQVLAVLEPLATASGLRSTVIFGGVSQGSQATALRNGVDIVVACPGRLQDLITQRLCDLSAVEITVLDEADHMADLGFLPVVKRILDTTPARGQRMLFSATLDNGIDVLVARYLSNPIRHSVDPAVAPVTTMTHHVFEVEQNHRNAVIQELAAGRGRSVLFTRTKHGAKRLAKQLTAGGVPAVDLHGDLAQRARERNLDAFMTGAVKVLVATDIAARGIHVDDIELVVHVDPPAEHKAYLHRSGRTARAGSDGVVVTVMTPSQRADVRTLVRQAGIRPTYAAVTPGAAAITELTGPAADHVTPTAAPPRPPQQTRPAGAPGRSRRPAVSTRGGTGGGHRSSAASVSANFSGSRRGRSGGGRSR
jgi:superfamily II DNA/RNA helicase